MILVSHPTGNSNVRNALHAFAAAGVLKEFWTCVAWGEKWKINHLLPKALRAQLCRRSFETEVLRVTHSRPWREVGRLLSSAVKARNLTRHEDGKFCVDAVYRDLDDAVARRIRTLRGLATVYAYEDGALATFREAQRIGIERIYDLPIGYWRAGLAIQNEEAQIEPEWASTLVATQDSAEKFERKDAELRLAERVIVASRFTRETLRKAPDFRAPVDVIPYGAPEPDAQYARRCNRRLRVMFAGSLSQRKGISYFFKALEPFGHHVDVTVVGRPASMCAPLDAALNRCTWHPSLPQPQLWEQMRRHDVLILPSLFEGFGLVLLEAMARGMVVITTANTAGPEIIQHNVDGFLVPIRSSQAISDVLSILIHDRERMQAIGEAALRAARRFTWESYQDRLMAAVMSSVKAVA
jgi:starch synthase